MGFYATEQLDTVLEPHQENPVPPSKNRVWNFFTTSGTCAGFFESQPVESHQEKWPTPTTTASGVRYYGHRYYSADTGRWLGRDPIENLLLSASSVVESFVERRILERARSQLLGEGLSPKNIEGIIGVIRRMLRHAPAQRNTSFDAALMIGDLNHLYLFCANDPLNDYDFLGLESNDEKYQKLIDVAMAAWEAAKSAVPGSEIPAAFEVFNGCNSLGLVIAWVDKKYKECICDKGFDEDECKKWEENKKWLAAIWSKQCNN